jgi:hypothetical protein
MSTATRNELPGANRRREDSAISAPERTSVFRRQETHCLRTNRLSRRRGKDEKHARLLKSRNQRRSPCKEYEKWLDQ